MTAALAACLVVSLSVVSLKTGIVSRPGSHSPQVTSAPGSLSPAPAVAGSGPAIQTTARALPATHPAHHNRTPSAKVEHSFLALPAYAQAAPGEELRIVRLKLTGSALRLLGAPVSEESSDRQVLADFVIGQDGTPYAVRLAQP